VFSWLGYTEPLRKSAFGLLALTWLLMAGGIVTRMWLEGRPPIVLKAGDVLFIPAGAFHEVRNVGPGNAAELGTYFVEKGKPLLVPR